jgi:hypothetical protein
MHALFNAQKVFSLFYDDTGQTMTRIEQKCKDNQFELSHPLLFVHT